MYEIKNINFNLVRGIVESVYVRKIFFVTIRRNAWHSTNIGRYQDGCMHSNLDSAKKFAEKLRKRGNTIIIEEIPALIIQGDFVTVLMTQINCDEIASGYHYYDDEFEAIIDIGNLISNQVIKLSNDSFAWRIPPEGDNLKLFLTYKKIKDFEKYTSDSIFIHKSLFKNGEIYWETKKNEKHKTSKHLQRICDQSIEHCDKDIDINLAKINSMVDFISNLKPWSKDNLEYVQDNINIDGCCEDIDKERYFIGLANIFTLISSGNDIKTFSEDVQDSIVESTIRISTKTSDGIPFWELSSITNIDFFSRILEEKEPSLKDKIRVAAENTKKRLLAVMNNI